jgi:hypothetical protein
MVRGFITASDFPTEVRPLPPTSVIHSVTYIMSSSGVELRLGIGVIDNEVEVRSFLCYSAKLHNDTITYHRERSPFFECVGASCLTRLCVNQPTGAKRALVRAIPKCS